MKLADLGEFELIHRFAENFRSGLPAGVVGIGDDAAVLPWDAEKSLLVTTDMLVENVHFLRSEIAPQDLGYKSVAVNLSDIAGIGGTPTSLFLSWALPPDLDVDWVDHFFKGMKELTDQHGVHLLGGDTTRGSSIVINITVLGQVGTEDVKVRSSAQHGDVLCVTSTLGDSAAGLQIILQNKPRTGPAEILLRRHHRPEAQVAQGRWLAARREVHAMMDISDGIASDLSRIAESSACGAEVDLQRLPISPEMATVCKANGWDAVDLATGGGEDYGLLCTVAAPAALKLAEEFQDHFHRPLFLIGKITFEKGQVKFLSQGQEKVLKGWDHFLGAKK